MIQPGLLAMTQKFEKIGFIGQPLQVAIVWQPKGSRYEYRMTSFLNVDRFR